MAEEYRGTVKSFNALKGWGFIEGPDVQAAFGKDIFVLKSALPEGTVNQGDEVAFRVVQGDRGLQAHDVRVLYASTPAYAPPAYSNGARPAPTIGRMPPAAPRQRTPPSAPGRGAGGSEYVGVVKSYNALKGWGFVTGDSVLQNFGKDVFFMKSALPNGMDLQADQRVGFSVVQGDKGIQAQDIKIIGGMPRQARSAPYPSSAGRYSPSVQHSMPPVPAPGAPGVPTRALQLPAADQYFFGAIKGYNEEKGWGHITCEAAQRAFGKEVFLLRSALGGAVAEPGMLVGFQVKISQKGPQAQNVGILPAGSFEFNGEPGARFSGTVKSYNTEKGWGFITSEEITETFFGKDVFLRKYALQDKSFVPQVGDTTDFSIEVGDTGKLQAKEVTVSEGFDQGGAYDEAGYGYAPARDTPKSVGQRRAPY